MASPRIVFLGGQHSLLVSYASGPIFGTARAAPKNLYAPCKLHDVYGPEKICRHRATTTNTAVFIVNARRLQCRHRGFSHDVYGVDSVFFFTRATCSARVPGRPTSSPSARLLPPSGRHATIPASCVLEDWSSGQPVGLQCNLNIKVTPCVGEPPFGDPKFYYTTCT